MKLRITNKQIVGFALTAILSGCGGSGGLAAPSVTRSYLGTQAPGDVWDWSIHDNAFTATNETKNFHYTGTYTTLPTGFLKLLVATTDDPGVSAGQAAYALEFPGTAIVIKPMGSDTNPPIVACALGTNPAGPTVSFNYVTVPSSGWAPGDEAYGYVDFTVTGNHYFGPTKVFDVDGNALADGVADFTGDDGKMTNNDNGHGGTSTAAMTPSGVCALDYGPGNGGAIGVRQPSSNVDLALIGTKSFRGFLINQGKTQCVSVTPNGDGTLHGVGYSNPTGVETGESDGGGGVTVTFTAQPHPGEILMDIVTSGGTDHFVMAANQVGGKYMLFGFGVGGDGKGYNVILTEN